LYTIGPLVVGTSPLTTTATTTTTTTTTNTKTNVHYHDLPAMIGPGYGPDSLPYLMTTIEEDDTTTTTINNSNNQQRSSYRNVTGVCNDATLMNDFDTMMINILSSSPSPLSSSSSSMATTTTTTSGNEDQDNDVLLINWQLAPMGVTCLVHPQLSATTNSTSTTVSNNNNSTTTTAGVVVGMDLLVDPSSRDLAMATIPQNDIVVTGPIMTTLHRCDDNDQRQQPQSPPQPPSNCVAIPARAMMARFPIQIPTTSGSSTSSSTSSPMVINGVGYPNKWGFVTALIHWDQWMAQSGIMEQFRDGGMEFQLTSSGGSSTGIPTSLQTSLLHGTTDASENDNEKEEVGLEEEWFSCALGCLLLIMVYNVFCMYVFLSPRPVFSTLLFCNLSWGVYSWWFWPKP
jgi:hypothetical protein